MTKDESGSAGHTIAFHRLVPPLIGALSVVRHQVYWHSAQVQDRAADASLPDIDIIRKTTFERDGQTEGLFESCDFSLSQPHKRMKYIYVWWRGMLVHVRIQQQTEYVALLTSINFSRNFMNCEKFDPGHKKHRDLESYYGRPDCVGSRTSVEAWFEVLGSTAFSEADKKAARDSLLGPLEASQEDRSLFAQFDSDFDMEALRRLVLPERVKEAPETDALGAAGQAGTDPEMIIDFRGLVTSAPEHEAKGLLARLSRGEKNLFRPCFTDAAQPVRETGLLLAERDQKAIEEEAGVLPQGGRDPWYLRKIGQYWRAVQPDAEVKYREEIEFSATGLLDGRALFITHLALPPPLPSAPERAEAVPPSPIRFFLHCRRSDERQIGRVVDRLCTMATVRAALERHAAQILEKRKDLRVLLGSIEKSMDGLIFQNHILNTIILKQRDEQETAQLQRDLDAQMRGMGANQEGAIDYFTTFSNQKPLKDQSSRDVLRALSSGMNELEKSIQTKLQLRPGKKPANVWGADDYMEYKVERATYYFDKFTRLEKHIRVSRVEGFQTYPEFVKRRMQDAFAYVRNAREYLREIADQRTRMSAQIGNITQIVEAHESDEEQRKIAEIQDFAEFALLTFLLPYYLGYILKAGFEDLGWKPAKIAIFFALIIVFTVINLFKRGVEGKLAKPLWKPPEKGFWRKVGWIVSSINYLSIAAIVLALAFIVLLAWCA